MKIFKSHSYYKSKLSKRLLIIAALMMILSIISLAIFYKNDTVVIISFIIACIGFVVGVFSMPCDVLLPTKITNINPKESSNPWLVYGNSKKWYGSGVVPNIQEEAEKHINGGKK